MAKTVKRMHVESRKISPNVEKLLASGQERWYADDSKATSGRAYFDLKSGHYTSEKVPAGVWSVAVAKKAGLVVKKNPGASLVDIGDGVACIEFHSKMNSLGGDIVQMITQTLKPGGAGDNFDAFVITNDAANFSVGANIMMLLMAVQEEEWDEVDLAVRQFQSMTQAIKFSSKPVVVAPVRHDTRRRLRNRTARRGTATACGALYRTGRGRRRAAARRRRLQGDDAARARQGVSHPARWSRRKCRADGGDEAGVRDRRHGQGVRRRHSRRGIWDSFPPATTSL